MIEISRRFEVEEQEFQDAINNAREMTKLASWWKRAIEDSKNNRVV